jgi:hypothetical protein
MNAIISRTNGADTRKRIVDAISALSANGNLATVRAIADHIGSTSTGHVAYHINVLQHLGIVVNRRGRAGVLLTADAEYDDVRTYRVPVYERRNRADVRHYDVLASHSIQAQSLAMKHARIDGMVEPAADEPKAVALSPIDVDIPGHLHPATCRTAACQTVPDDATTQAGYCNECWELQAPRWTCIDCGGVLGNPRGALNRTGRCKLCSARQSGRDALANKCIDCGVATKGYSKSHRCAGCSAAATKSGRQAPVGDDQRRPCTACGVLISGRSKTGFCRTCGRSAANGARVCARCDNVLGFNNISGLCRDCNKPGTRACTVCGEHTLNARNTSGVCRACRAAPNAAKVCTICGVSVGKGNKTGHCFTCACANRQAQEKPRLLLESLKEKVA